MGAHPIELRYDAQQVITMAQQLGVPEIEALGESTDLREAGLRAARGGDIVAGQRLVDDARRNIDGIALSDEAAAMFETYQLAAEAYLHYRADRYDAAASCMGGAIAAANKLRRRYGYVVELRRIHLAANLTRIDARRGRRQEALGTGLRLLEYIAGEPRAWPWSELDIDRPDSLSIEAKLFVVDQVLKPLGDLISADGLTPQASRTLVSLLNRLHQSDRRDALSEAIGRWISVTLQPPTVLHP